MIRQPSLIILLFWLSAFPHVGVFQNLLYHTPEKAGNNTKGIPNQKKKTLSGLETADK
ncbi:hypothetical protein [Salinithrix halophila]|uniref:Uncharacterized protein n=1 Tax=Salinithrix halophila TaxID=1485204 RepID=A0ABV8JFS9_9BACL